MLRIYWLDDRTYRVGDSDPVYVEETEDDLLQAFLERPVMDLPLLAEVSGVPREQIAGALKRLRNKYGGLFKHAIHCPGRRGQGGYRANVVDRRPGKATGPVT
jgi:hypothetical protein